MTATPQITITITATPTPTATGVPVVPSATPNLGGEAEIEYAVDICACGKYAAWQNTCSQVLIDKERVKTCTETTSLTGDECAESFAEIDGHQLCSVPENCDCEYSVPPNAANPANPQSPKPVFTVPPEILEEFFDENPPNVPVPPNDQLIPEDYVPVRPFAMSPDVINVETEDRDPNNLWMMKIIPQTGFITEKEAETYSASSPFADLGYNDEDYFYTLALWTQGVIQIDENGNINANYPLTAEYMARTIYAANKTLLTIKKRGEVSKNEMLASLNFAFDTDVEAINAIPNDLKQADGSVSVTKGDYHEALFRILTTFDTKRTKYDEKIAISVPNLGIENLQSERVLLSHPSAWLGQLQQGTGFYVDTREGHVGRIMLFGHSSRYSWMEANTEMKAMVNADAVGERVELDLGDETRTYEITSMELIDQTDTDSLLNVEREEGLTIFTCDYPDLTKRWVYHAKLVETSYPSAEVTPAYPTSWISNVWKEIKASLFSLF